MIDFSWQQWLRGATCFRSQCKKRRHSSCRSLHIEGLESRTLLTANLPVAIDDPAYVVNEDQILVANSVLTNDTDADGDTVDQAILGTDVQHGILALNADGTFIYIPEANYFGTDAFTYFAKDSANNETSAAPATVTITINFVNDIPVANPASINVTEDVAFNGALSGTDLDGDTLVFAAGSVSPLHGTINIFGNGNFTYTPAANFNGTDSFSFRVNDGTVNSAEATVSVSVAAVNDIPVANNGTLNTNEDTPANGTLTASDVEGSTLTFDAGLLAPAHGTVTINANGSFTYTPAVNFNGTDSFGFVANDGTSDSLEATIVVTINPINDVPVAASAAYSFSEDTVFGGILGATDADGDSLTFTAGTLAVAHGTLTISSNGFFIYAPSANFHGTDTFSFSANDGTTISAQGIITLTINPVNDAPVANAAAIETDINTAFNGVLTGTDVDEDPLTFSAGAVAAAHGSVTINPNGTFTYTPTVGYIGPDAFTFKVNDGTLNSAEATVSVTVNALNTAPTVVNGSATLNENTVLNASASNLGSDADGDSLTYAVVTATTHGTLVFDSNGMFVYTPTLNYNGPDSFTFKANDGQADSNVGTVSITVVSVDSPLTLNLPSSPAHVAKNSIKVQIDPAASVSDVDTVVNYTNAQLTVTIPNLPTADVINGRIALSVRNQGTGSGLVKVKGSKIYFNGSSIAVASVRGGNQGRPLVITFTSAATEQAVNAVLKQICIQASKKATSGTFTINFQMIAGSQTALASQSAIIS